jgi:hypothetical protein
MYIIVRRIYFDDITRKDDGADDAERLIEAKWIY